MNNTEDPLFDEQQLMEKHPHKYVLYCMSGISIHKFKAMFLIKKEQKPVPDSQLKPNGPKTRFFVGNPGLSM